MPPLRRQLSLFLPEPWRGVADAVRQRVDPQQHARIPAHVTLCRDEELESWVPVRNILATLPEINITLSFGNPMRLDDGCVMLPAIGDTSGYDGLRKKLLGVNYRVHKPHITILHPRHAIGRMDDLVVLAAELPSVTLQFIEAVAIEQINGGVWNVIERYGGRDGIAAS